MGLCCTQALVTEIEDYSLGVVCRVHTLMAFLVAEPRR